MKHIPRSSRIFIGLVVITFLLTLLALNLAKHQSYKTGRTDSIRNSQAAPEPIASPVDTSDWQTYVDPSHPITFLHPKGWKISSDVNDQDFYEILLNPGPRDPDMHIYISSDAYFGLDGFEKTPYLIDGRTGFSIDNNLIGIKVGEYYYTFDGSMNTNQADEFTGLITTVDFQ